MNSRIYQVLSGKDYIERLLEGKDSIEFLIMPMPFCNLKCKYCLNPTSPSANSSADEERIKYVLDRAISYIIDFLNNFPKTYVSVNLHGNEPFQIGLKGYKHVYDKLYDYRNRITFYTQTNGTIINAALLKFLQDTGWRVGLSIDGPENIHDFHRGKGTFKRVLEFIKTSHTFKLKLGAISVITQYTLENISAEKFYEWMKTIGIMSFRINPVAISREHPLFPDIDTLTEFYRTLFDVWAWDDYPLLIAPFSSIVEALLRGESEGVTCMFCNGCFRVIGFDYSGNITICGRRIIIDRVDNYRSIKEFIESEKVKVIFDRKRMMIYVADHRSTYCNLYQGGCPYEALVYHRSIFEESPYKRVFIDLFEYVHDFLRSHNLL